MPDRPNDFTTYMGQPPLTAWGPQPNMGYGGRPTAWAGAYSPPYMPSWQGLGGMYGGNIGAFAGGMMDNRMPMGGFGVQPMFQAGASFMDVGRMSANAYTLAAMAEVQESAMRERLRQRFTQITGGKVDMSSPVGQMALSAMERLPGVQDLLGGGFLSSNGIQSIMGAMAGVHNGWRPTIGSAVEMQRSFSAFYGFNPGGQVNLSRTMGLNADDLAGVLEVSTTLGGRRARERRRAQAELEREDINVNATANALAALGMKNMDKAWREAMRLAGGSTAKAIELVTSDEDQRQKLRETITNVRSDVAFKRYGDRSTSLEAFENRIANEEGREIGRVFKDFKESGFEGSVKELFARLEHTVGADAFDAAKMRQLADRMKGITHATGMALESVFGLFEAIDNSQLGGRMGSNRASFITGAAALSGADLVGTVTRQAQMAYQSSVAGALADPSKSRSGMALDILRYSGGAAAVAEYDKLPPAQREAKLAGLIHGGIGQNAGLTALARGHYDLASAQIQADEAELAANAAEYNRLSGQASLSDADRARMKVLEGSIIGSGGTVKGGRAVANTGIYDNMKRAATEGLTIMGGKNRGTLADVGTAMGIKNIAHAETAGALYSQFLAKTGNHAEALTMTQQALNEQGIKYDADASVQGIRSAGTAAASAMRTAFGSDAAAAQYLQPIGHQFRDPVKDQQMQEKAAKAAAMTNAVAGLGTIGDILRKAKDGKDIVSGIIGNLAVGKDASHLRQGEISQSTQTILTGLVNETDVEKREKALTAFMDAAAAEVEIEGLDETNPRNAKAIARAKAKSEAARQTLKALNYGDGQVSAFMEDIKRQGFEGMTADAQRKASTAGLDKIMEITGKLIIESTGPGGQKTETPATVEASTTPSANTGSTQEKT